MVAAGQRRVVITGMGLVSPLGNSPDALWNALCAGQSGVRALQSLPGPALPCGFGAEAWEFRGHIDNFGLLDADRKKTIRKALKLMCREIQMGVAAAQLGLQHAGLAAGGYNPERTGVTFGSDYIMTAPDEFSDGVRACLNDQGTFDFARWGSDGLRKVDPLWLLKYLPNMPASHIAIYNDLRGPSNSLTHREAAANLAIAEAYCTIERGSADIMVAGATGTRLHPLRTVHVSLQEQLAANGGAPEALSRPFDQNRTGMVLGEGAAVVVLEELASAQARGASLFGEVVGYGASSAMDRRQLPLREQALANVLAQALRTGRLEPDELGHVHAHGLSTLMCDREEAAAINRVLAGRRLPVPVVAAKSAFGNLGAAGGVVELIASLLALQAGHLFPVLNYETPDPHCRLNVVTSREVAAGDSFINLNVTPTGQASAVAVRKFA